MPPSVHAPAMQTGRRIIANTAALTGSNLWRIVVSFALQLLIVRRLGLDALGVYTISMAYLNVCQVVSEIGMPALLVRDLAQAPQWRRAYFRLALTGQLVAALLAWAGLIGLASVLPISDTLRTALWLIGASLPFYAFTSTTQTLFQAGERMELVMAVEICVNGLILICSLAVLWLGGGVLQLMGVIIGTQAVSASLGWWLLRRSRLMAPPQMPVATTPRDLGRRVGPFYTLALADVLLQRIDLLLLSVLAGEAVAGVYSAAYNLVRVLLKVVQSFLQALYPTMSRLRRQTQAHYRQVTDLSLRSALMILAPVAALVWVGADGLLGLVYGERYPDTVPVLQILIWTTLAALVAGFASMVFLVEQRPRRSLLITGVNLAALILLLPWLTGMAAATGAAWALALAGAGSALTGIGLARGAHLPVDWVKLALLVGVIVGAVAVGLALPGPWLLRAGVGMVCYLLLLGLTRQVTPADWRLLRRALGRDKPLPDKAKS